MICARAKGSFDTRTFFAGTAGFIQPRENGCARRSYAQNALQDAQERLRVLLGALCHAAQQAGVFTAARGIAAVQLRCTALLAAGPAERLTQAADARRRGALGAGLCAGHHKIDRRQPARLPALAFGKACKALPRTAACPRRKRAVSTGRAELRRAECQRRFPVKYRRVPPGEPLAGVRLRCGARLRRHHAAPDALFLLGIDRICQSDSLLPSIL